MDDREIVIVRRRGARDVALIPAEELAGLLETAHLMRSPKNAKRLLSALRRAERHSGTPQSVGGLTRSSTSSLGKTYDTGLKLIETLHCERFN